MYRYMNKDDGRFDGYSKNLKEISSLVETIRKIWSLTSNAKGYEKERLEQIYSMCKKILPHDDYD